MDYQALLKKSWQIVIKNRFLWFVGFLAGGAGLNSFSNLFNLKSNGFDWRWLENIKNEQGGASNLVKASAADLGRVLGDATNVQYSGGAAAGLAIVSFILFLLLIYVTMTAKSALVRSVYLINNEKHVSLGRAWREGQRYFWRRLSFALVLIVLGLVPFLVLALPVAVLGIFEMVVPAVILGIVFLLLLIVYLVYLSLISPYAERSVLLSNQRPINSIKEGVLIFNKNWKNLVVLFLILSAVSIGAGIAVLAALGLVCLVIIAIGALLYYALGQIITIIYAAVAILALVIIMAGIGGLLGAFFSGTYTLAYLEVAEPKE